MEPVLPCALLPSGRKNGKMAAAKKWISDALAAGLHVHAGKPDGTRCCGGDPGCPVERVPEEWLTQAR